jgi:hypothetical protein
MINTTMEAEMGIEQVVAELEAEESAAPKAFYAKDSGGVADGVLRARLAIDALDLLRKRLERLVRA